jgi:hypothetical protein
MTGIRCDQIGRNFRRWAIFNAQKWTNNNVVNVHRGQGFIWLLFSRILPFTAEKLACSLKTGIMIQFLHRLAVLRVPPPPSFRRKCFLNHNIGPSTEVSTQVKQAKSLIKPELVMYVYTGNCKIHWISSKFPKLSFF